MEQQMSQGLVAPRHGRQHHSGLAIGRRRRDLRTRPQQHCHGPGLAQLRSHVKRREALFVGLVDAVRQRSRTATPAEEQHGEAVHVPARGRPVQAVCLCLQRQAPPQTQGQEEVEHQADNARQRHCKPGFQQDGQIVPGQILQAVIITPNSERAWRSEDRRPLTGERQDHASEHCRQLHAADRAEAGRHLARLRHPRRGVHKPHDVPCHRGQSHHRGQPLAAAEGQQGERRGEVVGQQERRKQVGRLRSGKQHSQCAQNQQA
mmetsp:Transcript_108117/g.344668  ORF Transcript_108117/g.344668 Transcript_108117/m.344668 type:complete len:262 (-) Transcript_108117:463-1248(-)